MEFLFRDRYSCVFPSHTKRMDVWKIEVSKTATSTAQTIAIPSSIFGGREFDVAFLFDTSYNPGSAVPQVTPPGWTLLDSTSGAETRQSSCYKVLEASDLGQTITGLSGAVVRKTLVLVRLSNLVRTSGTLTTTIRRKPRVYVWSKFAQENPSAVIAKTFDMPAVPYLLIGSLRCSGDDDSIEFGKFHRDDQIGYSPDSVRIANTYQQTRYEVRVGPTYRYGNFAMETAGVDAFGALHGYVVSLRD